MKNSLQVFNYEGSTVRTVMLDGEVWFVAKDVCDILEISNVSKAIQELDDDEKSTLTISEGTSPKGGNPNMNVVSESGLYALIFKSRKPEAKAFARWVRHELLPQVMHTGSYGNPSAVRVLADQQSSLRSRRKVWISLLEAITSVEKILCVPTPSGVRFALPEHSEEDRNELLFLRSLFTSAKELMQNKLRNIDQRDNMLDQLMKY